MDSDSPDLAYYASLPSERDDLDDRITLYRSMKRYARAYWPLFLCCLVDANDALHDELCRNRFTCILSLESDMGLVVRKHGDFTERIGHVLVEAVFFPEDDSSQVANEVGEI